MPSQNYTNHPNKIGLFLTEQDDVVLSFPYKDCVLEAWMTKEDADRKKEYFLHEENDFYHIETLFEAKALTNFKYIAQWSKNSRERESSVIDKKIENPDEIDFWDENGDLQQNLLIKGNNLVALHSIAKRLAGKVKLIYIDPPYNTGSDGFTYNDNFNHSSWLVFMKNRLEIAKELLADDGVIFVQCDYNEDAYLRVLMDGIFERENFVANIAIKSSTPSGTKTAHKDKKIIKQKDTLLMYKKGEIIINPQYVARDNWDTHYSLFLTKENEVYKLEKVLDILNSNGFDYKKLDDINPKDEKVRAFIEKYADNIIRLQSHKNEDIDKISRTDYPNTIYENIINGKIENLYFNGRVVSRLSKGLKDVLVGKKIKKYWSILLCDFWSDIDFQNTQNEGGVSLTNGKKPEALLKRIIDMVTQPNDIVLDYHLGSGTTAAVAHKMGRRWIGIEQMDYIDTIAKERLKKVIDGEQGGISKAVNWQGGGDFVYFELKTFNADFADAIMEATSKAALNQIYHDMKRSAFLKFFFDPEEFENEESEQGKIYKELPLAEQKERLLRVLDMNHIYLNADDYDKTVHTISELDKSLTAKFYDNN